MTSNLLQQCDNCANDVIHFLTYINTPEERPILIYLCVKEKINVIEPEIDNLDI